MKTRTDRILEQLEADLARPIPRETPPWPLYHYTTPAGLEGILESRQLFATRFSQLNDPSELTVGEDASRAEAERLLGESRPSSPQADFLRTFVGNDAHMRLSTVGVYIASMTASVDLLSQWREYSGGGTGVSIGFKSIPLPTRENDDERAVLGLELMRCNYSAESFPQLAGAVLREAAEKYEELHRLYKRGDVDLDAVRREATHITFRRIAELVPRLKHPGFFEEAEWRLVGIPTKDLPQGLIKRRVVRGRDTEYIELALAADGAPMDLAHVFVGPLLARDEHAVQDVIELLNGHGYDASNLVRRSQIPLR